MDAITRPDLVAGSLPLEVVVPRSVEERAGSMITQGELRAGSPEGVQIFDYIPRAGEDGQFKLFNYRHLASEITSETPRTLLDIVSDEEHDLDNYKFSSKPFSPLEALVLGPSNEKPELENHDLSCKAFTAMNIMEHKKTNVSDHDPSIGFVTTPRSFREGSNNLHDPDSHEIITANPTLPAAGSDMLSPSRIQPRSNENYGPHSGDSYGLMNNATNEKHVLEELPRGSRMYGKNCQGYDVSRSCLDGSPASMETPEAQPTSFGVPRENIVSERPDNFRSKSNAPISTEHRDNIEEVRSKPDSCSSISGDTAGKQKSVYSNVSPIHAVVIKSASHKVEAGSAKRETQKGTSFFNPCRAETVSGRERVGETHEESFISAFDELHLTSTVSTQASVPVVKALAPKAKSEAKTVANSDVDLIPHSISGIGSWIKIDARHLQSLSIEGPDEICLWKTDIRVLEDLFNPGWQAAFRTCQGNSTSRSGSQGTNSFEPRSNGSRQLPPSSGNSHRKHPSDGGDGPGEEDDPVQQKKAKTENETNRRFVCPFHVHDPTYFRTSVENGQKYTHCAAGRGYADIPRLKEHIKRVHRPEITCARCGSTFEDQHSLDIHLRHEELPECPRLHLPAPRSMTSDMMAELSKRGKCKTSFSEEDKWYKIYELLFPNDSRPSMGPYWQDLSQPPTPSQEKQILVHMCENDLPRLLEQRLDTTLGGILPDQVLRERMKSMVISELIACIKQIQVEPSETQNTFDGSHLLGHRQSGESSTDSGYVSRCGNIECMGNCALCEQMSFPMPHQSRECVQTMSSPPFNQTDQYYAPSLFQNADPNRESQSMENMDEFLNYLNFDGSDV